MEQEVKGRPDFSDQTGFETLDVIADADRFNDWMYNTVARQTKGDILEIGSGIGNITSFFVKNNSTIYASDMRDEYCEVLKQKFGGKNNFKDALKIDIVDPGFNTKFAHLFKKFDSVVALNIVEHVENDNYAIQNCLKVLKPGGNLVILVPAFMFLFNSFDKELGHFRRYTRRQLEELYKQNNIDVVFSRYFNFAGTLGWWLTGNILKKKNIPSGQMKLYNKLVGAFKILDMLMNRFVGLSVIVAGRKTEI